MARLAHIRPLDRAEGTRQPWRWGGVVWGGDEGPFLSDSKKVAFVGYGCVCSGRDFGTVPALTKDETLTFQD